MYDCLFAVCGSCTHGMHRKLKEGQQTINCNMKKKNWKQRLCKNMEDHVGKMISVNPFSMSGMTLIVHTPTDIPCGVFI